MKLIPLLLLIGMLAVSGWAQDAKPEPLCTDVSIWAEDYKPEPYSAELVKRAEAGEAKAQHILGQCYCGGIGVSQDYKEAVKWYRKSETRQSQYKLGLCYENGNGVPKDEKEALDLYKKSADQNYEDAKKALERMKSK